MAVGKKEAPPRMRVDLLGESYDGQALLLVEVKSEKDNPANLERLRGKLRAANAIIPYAMLVDLDRIRLFQWDGNDLNGPIFETETVPTLRIYSDSDSDLLDRRIPEHYLTTLVEVWLRDLAYQWKSAQPPGSEALVAIGFLPLLDEMTLRTEVTIGGYPVP
jgi:hypothetical protein